MYSIVPAERAHIAPVGDNARNADELEFRRASGFGVRAALELTFNPKEKAWTGIFDGKPVMMCGVGNYPGRTDVGVPWLVATDDIENCPKDFHRFSKEILKKMHEGYRGLVNFVDADNTRTVRWLKKLGFTIMEPRPYGVSGMPFHPFYMGDIEGV